ncbi:MAG: hypothetical protein KJP21_05305 [Bacteroidia bacterium]|nr:hypothetical protein [Bacteroidia bacterium]NNJ55319.1 hypothetical protein [Bacteroidia bacterium]
MSKNLFLFVLILVNFAIILPSCGGLEAEDPEPEENELDKCRPCDQSITALKDAFKTNNCDYAGTSTEVAAVNSACTEANGEVYSYYLAEMCNWNSGQSPTCLDYGTPTANVVVYCNASSEKPLTEALSIKIECDGLTTNSVSLNPGGSTFFADFYCRQGKDATVTVSNLSGTELSTTKIPCTFIRPTNYTNDRILLVDSLGKVSPINWAD